MARHDVRRLFCVLALSTTIGAASAFAQRQELGGHIPPAVTKLNLRPMDRLPGSTRLNLAIGLPLRNPEALHTLLQQMYDPASPRYHHYLTPEQFTEKFGPTEQDYQAVIAFAKSNGLTVTTAHPNRVVVDVNGTVADIEKAFHVTMRVYRHPKEARSFYAPDVEPSMDLAVSVLHISGLDDFMLPHPNLKAKSIGQPARATPNSGSGPNGEYRGSDFRAAYVPGTPLTGAGQIVGLLQFDGYYTNDITTYESEAGLANVPLENVLLNGFGGTPGLHNDEVSLDIEMVISMAPGLSKVIVYETSTNGIPTDVLSRMATDNLAKQLSSSWTWSPFDPTIEGIFQEFQAQGQSYFNASGDGDAYTNAIMKPADDTNITVVGGTTLTTTGPGGSYVSETVWNWDIEFGTNFDGVGSGGGISTNYSIPPWQAGVGSVTNRGSTTMRNIPDVALTADNVYVRYNNGSTGFFGGTSCASPLWAGFMALVNQQATVSGLPPIGFLNPAVYAIGEGTNYAACFHDITTGNNTWSGSTNKFSAVSGYDLCTGWGTPNGTNLINVLAPPVFVPFITTTGFALVLENCPPTNGFIDPGETVTVNVSLRNIGLASTSNLVATLLATNGVASPSSPQTYGVLIAGGAAAAQPFTFTANGDCGSNIVAVLQLQDGVTNLGITTFSFTLGTVSAATNSFANTGSITIPTSGTNGNSSPYPSTISVPTLPGLVAKVTVTLTNLSHTWPADLDILVVGPGGQKAMLMSDAGGDRGVTPITNATLTFDDDAAASLPQTNQIVSGTYKPTDYQPGDVLGSPAPAGPYGTALSVFKGVNPMGTWSLYVFDDFPSEDGGNITNGWKLTIIMAINSCCSSNSNHPPVISAASISPSSPTTTNDLIATVTSTNDPDGDPISFAYQWQQSTNNVAFTNLTGQTTGTLLAPVTVAGDYYRVIIAPNDGQTNGAPFATASVFVPVDADGNGLNDDWEVQYFGHMGIDPHADPDGDGFNNLQEFLAGTSPIDASSAFRITSIVTTGLEVLVSFTSCTNKFYDLQFNDDLTASNWTAVVTNVPGTGIIVPATDLGAAGLTNRFYRVRLAP